jgi:Domain of unknown function (DUF4476)
VMYNIYTGSSVNYDSTTIKSQQSVSKTQPTAVAPVVPAVSGSSQNGQTLASSPAPVPVKTNKRDSLNPSRKPVPVNDSIGIVKKTTDVKDTTRTISNPPLIRAAGVIKLREITLKISRKMVFEDIGKDGKADTVTLFVYFENPDSLVKKQNATTAVAVIPNIKPADSIKKSQPLNQPVPKSGPLCMQAATDEDVAFLRSEILKANTEEEKIKAASDAFAIKCFSVSQVRLLASLLVSDKAKYRLMDAAHQHITNPDHFRELVDMLTDKNFQRKFLLMADKRS